MSKTYSLKHVRELSGDDKEFISVLIKTFLEEIPPDLERLVQAVNSDDPKKAYQYAHKMKPNLQLLDIDLLSQIQQIEAWSTNQKSKEQITPIVKTIVTKISNAIEDLKVDFQ